MSTARGAVCRADHARRHQLAGRQSRGLRTDRADVSLNPENGVSYSIVLQTPEYRLDSLDALSNLPIAAPAAPRCRCWAASPMSAATRQRRGLALQPATIVKVFAGLQGRDLGAVATDIRRMSTSWRPAPRPRSARSGPGPGQDDGDRLLRPAVRPDRRHRPDLPADRGELPVVERSVRHHHRVARRAGGHRLDAVRHLHHAVGARADRRHHVHGRGDREFHPGGELRARASGRAATRPPPRSTPAMCASGRFS